MPCMMHPHTLHIACRRSWLSSTHPQSYARARATVHCRPITQTAGCRNGEQPKAAGKEVRAIRQTCVRN